ncbi:MAG: hypothetical protein SOV85_01930 [Clostridium sp.]|uniref:hypothetical protein n=1 Tax=Clostridium sp. TaxID=1506 RepID=UPI002A755464|nr:hypothetical protein [Clostridium sp.]MDY2630103.1 hypothetical protein [Clostridium sp.]
MQYKNIEEFYLDLPDEVLERALKLDYNSKIKKAIDSVKKSSTKLKNITADYVSNRKFVDFLYEEYDIDKLDFRSITDVLGKVNKDNIVESVIYVIHEYLGDKRLNMNFNLISNKVEEIQKTYSANDETLLRDANDMELEDSLTIKDTIETQVKSIAILEEKDDYFNIYPLAHIESGKICPLEKNQRKDIYPNYGNINVYVPYISRLRNYKIDARELKIFVFSKDALKSTTSRSKYQIDDKYILNENNFYEIERENIFELIYLLEDSKSIEYKLKNKQPIIVNNESKNNTYIRSSEFIYGPFKTKSTSVGYELVLNREDYIVEKYDINKNEGVIDLIELQLINYTDEPKNIIYFKNDNLIKEEIDIINDKELVRLLKEKVNLLNTIYSKNDIAKIRESIFSIIDNKLSIDRIQRIRSLVSQTKITEEFISEELIDIIGRLLDIDNGDNILVRGILDNNDNLRKLQNYSIVENKIENKKLELERLYKEIEEKEIELKQIKEDIKNSEELIKENNINNFMVQNKEEIREIEEQKAKLQSDIYKLEEKYNIIGDYANLMLKVEELREKANKEEGKYQTFMQSSEKWKMVIKELEDKFKRKLTEAVNDYDSLAFDASFEGVIANEMMKASAEWSKKVSRDEFENRIISKQNMKNYLEINDKEELINYIIKEVNINRSYTRNEIINIMICITQGFLTVFAGEPGVGKTSICNIFSKALGLINNGYGDRYIEVSVEKGWTSKRDFVGYYNPLTKEFDKNNNLLFSAFNILDIEFKRNIKDIPFYILLDEANLSPIEHYWADFMNVCDLNKENRSISLGDGYSYNIPETLRFLATINYDHTTETLSPRLIDRAWIITLDNSEFDIVSNEWAMIEDTNNKVISFNSIAQTFGYDSFKHKEKMDEIIEVLEEIYIEFNENGISVSPRIKGMINRYISVGYDLFENTELTAKEFVALDYSVAQKLLPKIDGYGEDYKRFLNKLENIFDKNNMMKSKKIIKRILDKGDKNMEYYQFFI